MAKFLFIEQNAARRQAIIELGLNSFPNDEFIVRADRAEAMTALAVHHDFDGIVADGKFNQRGDGSLDFLAVLAVQGSTIPFVIHSSQGAEVIDLSLQRHGLICLSSHRFDATERGGLEKAIWFLKSNYLNQSRPGRRTVAAQAHKR